MIHRRGVLPAVLLLFLVVFGAVARIAGGSSPNAPAPAPVAPTPIAAAGATDVIRALAAVQSAYNRGDLELLCRSGGLVDPAVIRAQDGGCESELESLMANESPMRLTVRSVALRPDLATVAATTARGMSTTVDFTRRGHAWRLSFSHGGDPWPALAGTA